MISLISLTILSSCFLLIHKKILDAPPLENSEGEAIKRLDMNGQAINGPKKEKSREELLEELKKKQIHVTDKLSSHIFFPSGKTGEQGSWLVENIETNKVIIQCEVFLDDLMIAKSVPINPNQHIKSIILSEELDSGNYDVIAYINYYDLSSKEYLAKAGFKIKLTVQNNI